MRTWEGLTEKEKDRLGVKLGDAAVKGTAARRKGDDVNVRFKLERGALIAVI